jgi:hypothetical protein
MPVYFTTNILNLSFQMEDNGYGRGKREEVGSGLSEFMSPRGIFQNNVTVDKSDNRLIGSKPLSHLPSSLFHLP